MGTISKCSLLLSLGVCLQAAPALQWKPASGYRLAELAVPAAGQAGFTLLTPGTTGISLTNAVPEEDTFVNSLLNDGSGVAAGDVDGDGWCDLYFCRLQRGNALYRNLGNWRFEDVTAAAGVACEGQASTGATFADVDGDGDLDLLVNCRGGGTRLFLNDGKGRFQECTDCGLVRRFGATSMALGDLDGNGTLDLFVANYATSKIEDRPNARFSAKVVNGKPVLTAIDGVPLTSPELTNRYYVDNDRTVRERGEPDILYLNDGRGKFAPVSWTGGAFLDEFGRPLTQPPYDYGFSVRFRDLDGDGLPDLYVCSDLFPPDLIFINDGRGHFRAMSNLAVRHTSRFSMGLDFADLNRDGYDEFMVVDMLSREHTRRKVQIIGLMPLVLPVDNINLRPQYMRNTLFLNRGDGTYAEIAQLAGLEASEWSWMPAFLDVDLDGFEDVLIPAGHGIDSLHADAVNQIVARRSGRRLTDTEHRALKKEFFPPLKLQTSAFRNRGNLTFEDVSHAWGFDYVGISQGLCLADLDNDGDLDVIVSRLNEVAGIYRNNTAAPRVAVRLKGKTPNTRGIGARIKLLGGPVIQSQVIECGGRYMSCDDTVRVFAAGQATNGLSLEVAWRNGTVSRLPGVRPNGLYEIDETGALPASPSPRLPPPPLFTEVSPLLQHTNLDEGFNDWEEQPLLARRLSQGGPGICWADLDGDGWEDLVIGSGKGGRPGAYRNNGRGGFLRWQGPPFDQPVPRDQTTILGWRKRNGQTVLLAGSSNYEDGFSEGSCVRQYDLAGQAIDDTFPGSDVSVGPLALADVHGEGNLDLFVGGRVGSAKYPAPVSSRMFRGDGARFVIDEENSRSLAQVGLVSGAVCSDLDGDGWPDLILACEWGPLKVFRNDHGRLTPWDAPLTFQSPPSTLNPAPSSLSQLTGWWNSVTTGDFDGDGRLDLVAGNWGQNTRYQSHRTQPLQIFYGEWRIPGRIDQMEAYYDSGLKKVVPVCTFDIAKSMPWIAERFTTYEAFGKAGMSEILGDRLKTTRVLQANWLETTVFLNRGDHFEARALPLEAQLAPAFGISVGDMDGDGCEDIFLAQNFSAVDGDTIRYDAGRGLWLAGDGSGNFRAVPGQESGVKVYGDQRGCALCDYDGDGRVDLVVSQNAAETKLYHNERARPGLRVRLSGPAGNPWAIGASLRLQFGQRLGPAREIHAGSGYWSQDSPVQVLGGPEAPTRLAVRWPGGKTTTAAVPAGARELSMDAAGQAKVLR
jgi:enediyne biosynthesis protein E4